MLESHRLISALFTIVEATIAGPPTIALECFNKLSIEKIKVKDVRTFFLWKPQRTHGLMFLVSAQEMDLSRGF